MVRKTTLFLFQWERILFEKANSPKHSYFTSTDDHMMEFNPELLEAIKNFVKNISY